MIENFDEFFELPDQTSTNAKTTTYTAIVRVLASRLGCLSDSRNDGDYERCKGEGSNMSFHDPS